MAGAVLKFRAKVEILSLCTVIFFVKTPIQLYYYQIAFSCLFGNLQYIVLKNLEKFFFVISSPASAYLGLASVTLSGVEE